MSASHNPERSEPLRILVACRSAFTSIGLLSGMINVLTLTGSIYMLNVYDRVLPSSSIPTLVGLSLLAGFAYIFLGLLEIVRSRLLTRIGLTFEESLNLRVFDILVREPLQRAVHRDQLGAMRDLDQVRAFLGANGATALFDIPWLPFYLAICFAFHWLLGVAVLVGAVLLLLVAALGEILTRDVQRAGVSVAQKRQEVLQNSRRNAEAVVAMGMVGPRSDRWLAAELDYIKNRRLASDIGSDLGAISRILRMSIQSFVLGIGAYLVIKQEATGGVMIASAILAARALAPIELSIAHWKGFVTARQSWGRLVAVLQSMKPVEVSTALPPPSKQLMVEAVSIAPPSTQSFVVRDVSLVLEAGDVLGIVGPSASGKSSLARGLVGVWPVARGKVRLDGAALDQWPSDKRGRFIGYLPQDVELLDGTVADNIARFNTGVDSEAVIRAAQAAGVHEMIVGLPNGYDTQIGEDGGRLSAGQRQRVGLARALFGTPFLLVLDEPNSNLDGDGELALISAIAGVKARGGIVIVIAHRSSLFASVNKIMVMRDGQNVAFGPRDEVLARLNPGQKRPNPQSARAPGPNPAPRTGDQDSRLTP